MNPYQQGQGGYPQQQYYHNVGFGNSAPQSFGNPMPMPGMPSSGYPHPQASPYPTHQPGYPTSTPTHQPGYPTNPGYPSAAPASQPGYPNPAGYPSSQGYPSAGYGSQGGYQQSYSQTPSGYPSAQYSMGSQSCPQNQSYPGSDCPPIYAQAPNYGQPKKSRPAVVPVADFNPRQDAEILRKAMKGFGTDEKSIIHVLTKRSNEQRLKIAFEFKTLYGKDLVSDLKSETSGHFEDILVALMTPLPQYYAKELHHAMDGIGTNEDVLIEVMCTLSNHEIQVVKQAYQQMYHRNLEDDIRGETSGYFKRLMTSLTVGNRTEDPTVNAALAKEQARSLLQAGELRIGTDETAFIGILASQSFPQLAEVFRQYQELTGHDIKEAINSEFSGDIKTALKTIVKVVRGPAQYFAEVLHDSMRGAGTSDRKLIRVMVTRSEIDLLDIADSFQEMYRDTLVSWIEGDCSGHYKKCLLALLGAY